MIRMIGFALAATALAAASPALAQQAVGISAAVKNDVRIKKPGQPLPRPVVVKQRIALNDAVQTGVKSQLQVLLLDKSIFTVGANARLVIDKFVYDPNRGSRTLGATVAKGAFRFMSGKPDRGTGSQIRTPVASIGIRGTIIEGVVGESAALIAAGETATAGVRADPATASLIILRGPGAGTQGRTIPGAISVTAAGKTVNVDRPMMAVFVPGPGRAPIGPFRISPRALMQVQALIFPSVAERLGLRGPADNLGGDPDGVYYPPVQGRPDFPGYDGYPGPVPGGFPRGDAGPPGAAPGGFGTPNMPGVGPVSRPQGPRNAGPQGNRGANPNNPQGSNAQRPVAVDNPSPANDPPPAGGPVARDSLANPNNAGNPKPKGQSPNDNPRPSPSPTPTPGPNDPKVPR
jgi:hypothetical protein